MKKTKFASAIVALAIGALVLASSLLVLFGKNDTLYGIFLNYGIGIAAVLVLVTGILQVVMKDIPVSGRLHITFGIVGILFQLIAMFVGGYFMLMLSTAYGIILLSMELREMKNQKGFAEKGLGILIGIFSIFYLGGYLITILLSSLPNTLETIFYGMTLTALPVLLIAKGIVDIVRSFKHSEPEATEEKPAEEPAVEKAE